MTTYTITLPEAQVRTLNEQAALYNVSPQEFVQRQIEEVLTRAEPTNGVADRRVVTDADQTERMKAIIDDLMVRRHDVYVELAKGPEG